MSGICGIVNLSGRPVEPGPLEGMLGAIAHRGPDGAGIWHQGPAGLAHCMLHTTPESLEERLPLHERAAGLVITADARIDNREELFAALGLRERREPAVTDSELILEAYQKWGKSCPERLTGDFAFAIWDDRSQTLFAARDALGIKPFFYCHQPDRFLAFGSEPKAVLAHPETPRRLNEALIATHLSVDLMGGPEETYYQDVLRLAPGHALSAGRDGLRVWRHWNPEVRSELRLRSDKAYAEAFWDLFTEAVRCRTRSAFPVATTLSGGLDSSSVACTLAKLRRETGSGPVPAFSSVFPRLAKDFPKGDERAYMDAVVAQGGIEPHFIHADEVSPLVELERFHFLLDRPLPGANFYMYWRLFEAVRRRGARVLFTGNDGDTVISYGLECLPQLFQQGRWLLLGRIVSGLAGKQQPPYNDPLYLLRQEAIRPCMPETLLKMRRKLLRQPEPPTRCTTPGIINPEFARRIDLENRLVSYSSYADGRLTPRENHWRLMMHPIATAAMEGFEAVGTSFGIELRHPFYDRRVVEFCIRIPYEQKLLGGWTRSILRRGMEGILPPIVQWRVGKGDLGAQAKLGLLEHERALVEDVVLHNPEAIAGYVDCEALRTAYRRYAADPGMQDRETYYVMVAVTLAVWLRQQRLPAPPAPARAPLSGLRLLPQAA
jgi:asparagine synthase (glutamine-hydrolysing)